ncbi:TPA: phage antirepressor protein [Candidatus Uhrbacteria bacterium]|nr:phage antirepressor protein [Candidatus Uhrbacteria bacterium]
MENTQIAIFKGKQVRKTIFEKEWWFVVEDVVLSLIDSNDPKQYIQRMKLRDPELTKGWVQIVHTLAVQTTGGKQRMICANTEGVFRIIQSIPSAKAEPFKRWLAKVGYERLEEIENPELAAAHMRELYKAKGYSDEWIEKRVRGIAIRDELTNEWKKRGVKEQREYSILTAEISRATFGMTPAEYKAYKSLDKPADNLRDHMNDLELIFTMLGEASTTEIARNKDAQGYVENRSAALEGGSVAGRARRDLEKKSGKRIASKENYKQLPEAVARKKVKKEA